MCNISFLSLIRDTKFYASLYSSFPENISKDATAVLQPLLITLAGLSILRFFILPYNLPGLECSGVINLTQSLLKSYLVVTY